MRAFVGTSGYSYKEWKGSFFPADLPASQMLRFYGERFNTVEINNSFYRMPSGSVLAKWVEEVPSTFVFVLKAPRSITHQKQLHQAGDGLAYFWKTAQSLGPKLGPILFQLPPFFRKDLPRLRDFLRLLPEGCRAAFEFRHASWEGVDLGGHALVGSLEGEVPFRYLRLREPPYDDASLAELAARIRFVLDSGIEVYAYFKHEDEPLAPAYAERLDELVG